jgi:preprotein translocase subunit SecE
MKLKQNNLGFEGKKKVETIIAFTVIFVAIFVFIILVVDTIISSLR